MTKNNCCLRLAGLEAIVGRQPFPAGCTIRNIRRGDGYRAKWVYASLYAPDGELLISATLDYINEQLVSAGTLPPNASLSRGEAVGLKHLLDDTL